MVGAEPAEARLASVGDAVSSDVVGLHLGDQEDVVALLGNHLAEELLGTTVSVITRRIEQRHAERNTCLYGLFFDSLRMPSLSEMPGTLTDRWDGGAVWKLHGPPCGSGCCACSSEGSRASLQGE